MGDEKRVRMELRRGYTFVHPKGSRVKRDLAGNVYLYGPAGLGGIKQASPIIEAEPSAFKGQEHKFEKPTVAPETPKAPKVEDKEVKGAETKAAKPAKKKSGRRGRPPKKKPAEE